MCEAAHIIGFWENLMRNVCVYMKMSAHYWDVLWNWGLHCVSLLSRRNNRDTSDSFVIFLSQGAVLSLSVYLSECFDIWLRHQGPLAPRQRFSLSAGWVIVWTYWRKNSLLTAPCIWKSFLANIGTLYCTVPLPQ